MYARTTLRALGQIIADARAIIQHANGRFAMVAGDDHKLLENACLLLAVGGWVASSRASAGRAVRPSVFALIFTSVGTASSPTAPITKLVKQRPFLGNKLTGAMHLTSMTPLITCGAPARMAPPTLRTISIAHHRPVSYSCLWRAYRLLKFASWKSLRLQRRLFTCSIPIADS